MPGSTLIVFLLTAECMADGSVAGFICEFGKNGV